MRAAIEDADVDVVVIGLPNHLHEEAVIIAAEAGKAVLCTKPLGRTAAEAKRMLDAVERAGLCPGNNSPFPQPDGRGIFNPIFSVGYSS